MRVHARLGAWYPARRRGMSDDERKPSRHNPEPRQDRAAFMPSLDLLRQRRALSRFRPAESRRPSARRSRVSPARIDTAITRGVDFLVADQNKNGSWGGPTRTKGLNIYAPLPGAHHAFRAGASGLALSGLIDSGDARPEVAGRHRPARRLDRRGAAEAPPRRPDHHLQLWGHAYGLRAIDPPRPAREDRPAQKAELEAPRPAAGRPAQPLRGRQRRLGIPRRLRRLHHRKPSGIPTSFTTATVLLAMDEARETHGREARRQDRQPLARLDQPPAHAGLLLRLFPRPPDAARASTSTARPARSPARRPAMPPCACSATRR